MLVIGLTFLCWVLLFPELFGALQSFGVKSKGRISVCYTQNGVKGLQGQKPLDLCGATILETQVKHSITTASFVSALETGLVFCGLTFVSVKADLHCGSDLVEAKFC